MRKQRTIRQRTFSVSVARSAWVIGRAGNCLRQAAWPQEGRRPVTGWREDAVSRARMQMPLHVLVLPRFTRGFFTAGFRPGSVLWPMAAGWHSAGQRSAGDKRSSARNPETN